jgi:hypothetical protein
MMRPIVASPTGTEIGAFGVVDLHAAAQAVGRSHGDRTHDPVAQLLLYFEHQVGFAAGVLFGLVEQQRIVDLGHRIARELDIHHGADTLNNVSLTHRRILNRLTWFAWSDSRCAADDFRKLFGDRRLACLVVGQRSSPITFLALSDADFMATIRALCSDAMFSATAWYRTAST